MTHEIILGACGVIVLSYFFNIISQKTSIPTVIMLMLLGFGLKFAWPIEQDSLRPALEMLGTVGVILIVLEAALDLKLSKETSPILVKALLASLVLLLVTSGLIALSLYMLLEMDLFTASLYAVPLSVMSSAIIIPSVGGLNEHSKEFLIFESAFSDILGIILFYYMKDAGLHEPVGFGGAILDISGNVLLTVLIGGIVTFLLIIIFQNLTSHVRLFLLISILIGLYSAGKLMHLSSLIIILIFGLVLNNKDIFFRGQLKEWISEEGFGGILRDFKMVTLESAFVVRTFFFVVFGMSIVMSQLAHVMVFVISALALIFIYASRFLGLKIFLGKTIAPEIYVAPRGLITILLFYAIPAELENEQFQPGILLLTIIITSLIMTYGLIKYAKNGSDPHTEGENGEKRELEQNLASNAEVE